MARIKKDKSTIYLGVFKDEKDAAMAYNKAVYAKTRQTKGKP